MKSGVNYHSDSSAMKAYSSASRIRDVEYEPACHGYTATVAPYGGNKGTGNGLVPG